MSTEFVKQLNTHPATDEVREAVLENPGFGQHFTDHMVCIDWQGDVQENVGRWDNARLQPYGPLSLDPSTAVLHYGQEIFEGLKAYRHADGSVWTFRPEANAARLNRSAQRLALPTLPEEVFVDSIRELVVQDQQWVPSGEGESLYLRPFMIGTEKTLGVKPSSSYSFYIIASPAGAYFSGGIKPVSVWISEDYVRAAPGGTGDAKFAGNYAASLLAQQQAAEKGCDQVVWLDAIERKYIEEMGGMNLMFVEGSDADAKIITPALSGSLLPGITRKSLLQVAEDLGYSTEERKITVEEWRSGVADGTITETMACGTAAVITPVGTVKSNEGEFTVNNNEAGEITMAMRERLRGIQTGDAEDTHGWNTVLIES